MRIQPEVLIQAEMEPRGLLDKLHLFSSKRLLDASPPSSPLFSTHPSCFLSRPLSSSSSSLQPSSPTGSSSSITVSDSFSVQVESLLTADRLPLGAPGPKRLCLVCGDFASGFHYGVASCEACKAFFKRTIQGNIKYCCVMVGACEVTKRRRKACQACRFQKCLQVGMVKEGVRVNRVRGGRQKYRKQMEVGPYLIPRAAFTVLPSSRNQLTCHLLLIDPTPPDANQDESINDCGLRTLLTLCDLLNQELLLLIGWAKQIPGFSALSLVDQMSLLQSSWMEVLLVGVAWRSQGAKGEELVFGRNLRLDRNQCRDAGLAELFEALCHLTSRYRALDLIAEEVVTLKAITLANADVDSLERPESLQDLQDQLQQALQEQRASSRGQRRAGRLLMTLPLLRQTARGAVQALLRLHCHHRVPLHRLLLEMLDAKA